MPEIDIRALSASPRTCELLSEILIETVANGGSVSFMHPLEREAAEAFWDDALAAALMRAAEGLAMERARTLLVLDTAIEGGASGLYERLGYTLAGAIPDYALKPPGGLTGTLIYWKRIGGNPVRFA